MTNRAPMAARQFAKAEHALRGGKRACPCCHDHRLTAPETRRIQRRRERQTWKREAEQ
jgi:hypothetical protein